MSKASHVTPVEAAQAFVDARQCAAEEFLDAFESAFSDEPTSSASRFRWTRDGYEPFFTNLTTEDVCAVASCCSDLCSSLCESLLSYKNEARMYFQPIGLRSFGARGRTSKSNIANRLKTSEFSHLTELCVRTVVRDVLSSYYPLVPAAASALDEMLNLFPQGAAAFVVDELMSACIVETHTFTHTNALQSEDSAAAIHGKCKQVHAIDTQISSYARGIAVCACRASAKDIGPYYGVCAQVQFKRLIEGGEALEHKLELLHYWALVCSTHVSNLSNAWPWKEWLAILSRQLTTGEQSNAAAASPSSNLTQLSHTTAGSFFIHSCERLTRLTNPHRLLVTPEETQLPEEFLATVHPFPHTPICISLPKAGADSSAPYESTQTHIHQYSEQEVEFLQTAFQFVCKSKPSPSRTVEMVIQELRDLIANNGSGLESETKLALVCHALFVRGYETLARIETIVTRFATVLGEEFKASETLGRCLSELWIVFGSNPVKWFLVINSFISRRLVEPKSICQWILSRRQPHRDLDSGRQAQAHSVCHHANIHSRNCKNLRMIEVLERTLEQVKASATHALRSHGHGMVS